MRQIFFRRRGSGVRSQQDIQYIIRTFFGLCNSKREEEGGAFTLIRLYVYSFVMFIDYLLKGQFVINCVVYLVMLAKVSGSFSPMKGEKPERRI